MTDPVTVSVPNLTKTEPEKAELVPASVSFPSPYFVSPDPLTGPPKVSVLVVGVTLTPKGPTAVIGAFTVWEPSATFSVANSPATLSIVSVGLPWR